MDLEAWGPAPSLSMGSSQRRLPRRGAAQQEFSGCIYLLESKCADTVSAATEFHLAEKQVLIHQARPTLPRLYSGLSTQTETTHCRYTDVPCSFLQASSIIQHVFSTQQQIVSGITRQEHVFGNGVLPAKPGTCSVELQFSALTGSKQQPRQQWRFWWCWQQGDERVCHFSRNGDNESPYFCVFLQGKYYLSSIKYRYSPE